jgi:tRNA threonylcarbamoyladenosine biosynthesis protein TsaE
VTHLARKELSLPDLAATARLGRAFASAIRGLLPRIRRDGLQLNLRGELGAGKTALVRAILRGLGVEGPVKSPSFALLEPYAISSLDFYHFDFYRFGDPAEFGSAGFRELFGPGRICAIEWPEKAGERLPAADLAIALVLDGDGRRITIDAESKLGAECLRSAMTAFDADDG